MVLTTVTLWGLCAMSTGDKSNENLESKARAPSPAPLPASTAHEINNPLDSLLNLLHLLEPEALTDKGRHYLRLAEEEVSRIAQIARESLGKHEVLAMPERTNVGELLASVLDFFKERLQSSGVVVKTRSSCPDNIRVYAGQLRQAFSNLLLNAVEAMPEGGTIHTKVCAGREWRGQQRRGVRVTVADNGCGISNSMMAQLFQRRFTTKSGGHGMGLSQVKTTVQNHEGLLRVRSSTLPGRHGTVFNLFLPAA